MVHTLLLRKDSLDTVGSNAPQLSAHKQMVIYQPKLPAINKEDIEIHTPTSTNWHLSTTQHDPDPQHGLTVSSKVSGGAAIGGYLADHLDEHDQQLVSSKKISRLSPNSPHAPSSPATPMNLISHKERPRPQKDMLKKTALRLMIWNIQGLAGSHTMSQLKALKKLHRFVILVIIEAKVSETKINQYRLKLGFTNSFAQSKDIWLFWDRSIQAEVIDSQPQSTSVNFRTPPTAEEHPPIGGSWRLYQTGQAHPLGCASSSPRQVPGSPMDLWRGLQRHSLPIQEIGRASTTLHRINIQSITLPSKLTSPRSLSSAMNLLGPTLRWVTTSSSPT